MNSNFKIVGTVSKADTLFDLLKTPEKLEGCDLIELRFDEHMDKFECLSLCQKLRKYKKVLLTIRTDREGGTWTINDNDRYELFKFFEKDVDMIDIELKSELFAKYKREDFSQDLTIISSFHDYKNTPNNEVIARLIEQGKNWNVDIVKLAVYTNTEEDLNRLESFLNTKSICLIGMGNLGVKTRTEFTKKGSCLTYGYLDESAAPGQLSAKELSSILR
ncbi:MAG: type I 3-dehydroquinate dehydratase [Lentisphaeraceae bacterium]|nr:type I 3-dehydroquinate dehydratase [Lentisphaeraceae bacterium]